MTTADPAIPAGFSASDAALDGFRVVREHWRLMVGWAVFNLVALVALVVASVIVMLMLGATAGPQAAAGVGALIGTVGAALVEAMIVTALYRTLLRYDQPGFLHLRIGREEWRMLAFGLIPLIALGIAVQLTAWVQQAAETPPAVVFGGLCFAGLVYLAIRFSLAVPATFEAGRFQFAQSWRLTRGRVTLLLGMNAIMLSLLALVAVVGWFVLYLVVGAVSGFHEMGLPSLSDEALARRPVASMVQMVGEVLYGPLLWAISQAPQIAAYKAFSKR